MKLGVVSDLHWETEPVVALGAPEWDVLVVAGDVLAGHDPRDPIEMLAAWAQGRPLVYVPGNHEFETREFLEAVVRLKSSAACYAPNIHVLYNDVYVLDGVRFLGSTLWTDFALKGQQYVVEASKTVEQNMPDFKIKRSNGLRLKPQEVMNEHQRARDFLNAQLKQIYHGPTVVVSHFAPHPNSVHPKYAKNPLNPWFACALPEQMIAQATVWVHGHTHTSFDYPIDYKDKTCRVVCNPSGFQRTFSLAGKNDFERIQLLSLFPQLSMQDKVLIKENPDFVLPKIIEI